MDCTRVSHARQMFYVEDSFRQFWKTNLKASKRCASQICCLDNKRIDQTLASDVNQKFAGQMAVINPHDPCVTFEFWTVQNLLAVSMDTD